MSIPHQGIRTEFTPQAAASLGIANDSAVWVYNSGEKWDGTSRLIVAMHGLGTTDADAPSQFLQNAGFAGQHLMALARTGRYVIAAPAAGGAAHWSKPAVMGFIDTAVAAAVTRGARPGKYGMLGYSMGTLACMNKLKRASASIAGVWLWAPVIDLDYAYSSASSPIKANSVLWTAEIDAAFGSFAATAGYRVHDEPRSFRKLGVPVRLAYASDDTVALPSISTDFAAKVNDPKITLRAPALTGGHIGLFAGVPDAELVDFFDYCAW